MTIITGVDEAKRIASYEAQRAKVVRGLVAMLRARSPLNAEAIEAVETAAKAAYDEGYAERERAAVRS